MTATFEQAVDEIFTVFKDAWDTTGFVALYPNTNQQPPTGTTPWARASLVHTTGGQATLANHNGQRRYERVGIFTAQIFVPIGEGLSRGNALAKIVADAYEGTATPSQIWFRDVRKTEVGPDGSWYQINVTASFTYDEVK